VAELSRLPDADKRRYGIANGAGVSVVRCSREIDYGWHLLEKRRENYDDWWRCEVRFSPDVDELFGVTHTKQGIRPSQTLRDILSGDLDAVARGLNHRVRSAFTAVAQQREQQSAAVMASARDDFLPPVSGGTHRSVECGVAADVWRPFAQTRSYELRTEESASSALYRVDMDGGRVIVTLNSAHEFYRLMYGPNRRAEREPLSAARRCIELLLIALGRSELRPRSAAERRAVARYREEWGRAASVLARNLR
jgi:hypothetical protein